MNQLKHLMRLISYHEVSAVLYTVQLAKSQDALFIASQDFDSALRAEEIHVSKGMGDWKVDLWVAEAVGCGHGMPYKERVLQRHHSNYFEDAQAGEHVNLVVSDGLSLGLSSRVGAVFSKNLGSHIVFNNRCSNLRLHLLKDSKGMSLFVLSYEGALDNLRIQEFRRLVKVWVPFRVIVLWIIRLHAR